MLEFFRVYGNCRETVYIVCVEVVLGWRCNLCRNLLRKLK